MTISITSLARLQSTASDAANRALTQRLKDETSIVWTYVEDTLDDAAFIDERILSLKPTSINEAALQLRIALSYACPDMGDKLHDADESQADHAKSVVDAVVALWGFCADSAYNA